MSDETFAGEPLDPHSPRDEIERLRAKIERLTMALERDDGSLDQPRDAEIERLRADVERLTRERDEARGNAETLRNSMYSLEECVVELTREKGEALNELDTIYGALGTADAEGAPDAAASIGGLFDRAEAAERKVEKLRKLLRELKVYAFNGIPSSSGNKLHARIDSVLAGTEKE